MVIDKNVTIKMIKKKEKKYIILKMEINMNMNIKMIKKEEKE